MKFKNVAYFHSRWVPESFVEKQRLTQLYIKFPKVDPVTGEANTKSVSVDVAKEVMELDKIVAVKPGALYLCKWKGLNYDELTEESFEFVEEHFPSCVPDFNKEEMRWTEKNEKAGELEDAAKKPEDGEVRAKVWTTKRCFDRTGEVQRQQPHHRFHFARVSSRRRQMDHEQFSRRSSRLHLSR